MKMEYVNVNGYLIPKLENGPITDNTIGKYGMMRARYLMDIDQWSATRCCWMERWHNDSRTLTARHIVKLKVYQSIMAAEAKINEEMKRCNLLEWAAAMRKACKHRPEEIVCELIYAEEHNDSLLYRESDSVPGQCGKHRHYAVMPA